jgi:molecular chaperone GrpE
MNEENNQNPNNNFEDELLKCQKERDEYLNNWKKERADFINYKKDESKRMEEFLKFANESLITEIIEVLDDLELAYKNFSDSNLDKKNLLDGLNQIINKFQSLLKKNNVERIKVDNVFDPLLHEVVDNLEGDKIEEVRAGYMLNGRVIRPSRVKFSK